MNSFNTKSFNFYTYDYTNENHRTFIKELLADPLVNNYIKDIDTFLYQESDDPLNSAYLVGKDDLIVGYINLYEYHLIVDIDLAVGESFRGIRNNSLETVGTKILRETSEYILDNYKFIRYLRVMIAASNIRSIKTALNAGFKYVDHFSEGNEYRKYIERSNIR